MSWGSGTGVIYLGRLPSVQRITTDSGPYYRTVYTYSYMVRCLSSANADSYTPTAVHSGTIRNVRPQRIDESNQFAVYWDEEVMDPNDGTYHAGYG